MPYNPKLPDPQYIVKIVMLDAPLNKEIGEGLYEVRRGDSPKHKDYYDIMAMESVLKKFMPGREVDILDRLQNFKKAYLNLKTGEISS